MAAIIDGKAVAADVRAQVAVDAAALAERTGHRAGLVTILVGEDPASEVYVRNKIAACREAGMESFHEPMPATSTQREVLEMVDRMNADDRVDGILVQSPLPAAMGADAERRVFDAIDPAKDVDGLHPINVGRLVQSRAALASCTPSGVIQLLERSGVKIAGAHAVVIGRSDIVGKPMALLLLHGNATVTVCHSRTVDLPRIASEGDILVSAIGRPGFVTPSFVKPGATVIDVGTTQVSDGSVIDRLFPVGSKRREVFERKGSLVVGDVHPEVAEVAGALSPVPGGVGPLTIAMLLKNTVTAAIERAG